jgi:peptidoglycan/LPS O-acetylase OafA/YrhL
VVAPLLRFAALSAGWAPTGVAMLTPMRLDTMAARALLGLAVREGVDLGPFLRRLAVGCGIGVLGVRVAVGGKFHERPVVLVAGLTLLAGVYTGIVGLCVQAAPTARVVRALEHPLLRSIGTYTYGMYLAHVFVLDAARALFERTGLLAGWPIAIFVLEFALTALGSYLLAAASFRWFEGPLLALKRFFPRDEPAPAEVAPAAAGNG